MPGTSWTRSGSPCVGFMRVLKCRVDTCSGTIRLDHSIVNCWTMLLHLSRPRAVILESIALCKAVRPSRVMLCHTRQSSSPSTAGRHHDGRNGLYQVANDGPSYLPRPSRDGMDAVGG